MIAMEPHRSGVRSLRRGLDILAEINRSGSARAGDLARKLGLARPTVYRLLETLEETGYVARSASDDRFRVTLLAHRLGGGFDRDARLSQAAGPVLVELGRALVWPVDLVTCEAGMMVVQETTHDRSPLSIDRGMIGTRLPMLRTAAGRAYLAFCAEADRRALIGHLRRIDDGADRPFLAPAALERMIADTVARGYGVRTIGDEPIPHTSATKTSSIAVPIRTGDVVLGCLTIIWLAKAVEMADAITQFFGPMHEAAAAIAGQVSPRPP